MSWVAAQTQQGAFALDAADGRIDGKYFGSNVGVSVPGAPVTYGAAAPVTSYAAPAAVTSFAATAAPVTSFGAYGAYAPACPPCATGPRVVNDPLETRFVDVVKQVETIRSVDVPVPHEVVRTVDVPEHYDVPVPHAVHVQVPYSECL